MDYKKLLKNNLVLKKNNKNELFKMIEDLINNKKKIEKNSERKLQKNQLINNEIEINKYHNLKIERNFNQINYKHLKILHIGTFGEKQDYRTYYCIYSK